MKARWLCAGSLTLCMFERVEVNRLDVVDKSRHFETSLDFMRGCSLNQHIKYVDGCCGSTWKLIWLPSPSALSSALSSTPAHRPEQTHAPRS